MLDKSVPYFGVLMVKNDTKTYPRFKLPQGFTITGFRQGLKEEWSQLMLDVGQADTLQQARGIFEKEFLAFPERLAKRCLFVLGPGGEVAATASLWHGNHFGRELQRIHWVAAAPAYQGKGLVKALLTRLLDLYNELGYDGFIYLTSQTWSYKALNIYSKFGFTPYSGEKPANWSCEGDFADETQRAWEIIRQKISEYSKPRL